jgi:hypothetical protein
MEFFLFIFGNRDDDAKIFLAFLAIEIVSRHNAPLFDGLITTMKFCDKTISLQNDKLSKKIVNVWSKIRNHDESGHTRLLAVQLDAEGIFNLSCRMGCNPSS